MKKVIHLLLACCLAVIFLNNEIALSHCGRHLSLSNETPLAAEKKNTNQLIDNDIAWFYPEDTIALAYIDLTKTNIGKIETILNSRLNQEQPSKDLAEMIKYLGIVSNLTLSFGPDVTIGVIKSVENKKTPPVLVAVKLKVDNFSIDSIASILGEGRSLQKDTFEGLEIHRFIGKKHDLMFAKTDNYLLISDNLNLIKISIDNYKARQSSILSLEDAQKALKYLPDNALALIITNNIELSKVVSKPKSEMNQEKLVETDDDQEQSVENKEDSSVNASKTPKKTSDTTSESQLGTIDKESSASDSEKQETTKETSGTFDVYLNKIQQTDSFTATALFLQNNAVGIKSYTPYNLGFLDSLNPKLKSSITKMLDSGKYYDVAKSLPSDVAGYFLVSNLAGITEILENIDDEKFQQNFASIKVMFSAMTGIDFKTDFVPMFSGQTTIAVMPGEDNPEPLLLLSNSDKSYQTLNQLLAVINKMEPTTSIKDKKIKKDNFTIVSTKNLPVDIAFGTINDAITFSNFEVIKTIAKYTQKATSFLANSITYKDFSALNQEPCNAAVYVEFERLKEAFGEKFVKDIPKELEQICKSMYISVANQKDNVFQVTVLMQLNQ